MANSREGRLPRDLLTLEGAAGGSHYLQQPSVAKIPPWAFQIIGLSSESEGKKWG